MCDREVYLRRPPLSSNLSAVHNLTSAPVITLLQSRATLSDHTQESPSSASSSFTIRNREFLTATSISDLKIRATKRSLSSGGKEVNRNSNTSLSASPFSASSSLSNFISVFASGGAMNSSTLEFNNHCDNEVFMSCLDSENFEYQCVGNAAQVLCEQSKFFNNPLLSDVKIVVGSEEYFAHKLILARASQVFERMLSKEWNSSSTKNNTLHLIEDNESCFSVFPNFLHFLYSSQITLTCTNALPILILADKYDVPDLRKIVISYTIAYLIPNFQLKQLFSVWFQYATKSYHTELIHACVKALALEMQEIACSDEWQLEWVSLDADQLVEFLKSSELIIKDEFNLWLAVEKWIANVYGHSLLSSADGNSSVEKSHYLKSDETYHMLTSLLPHIRFPMMTPDQLCDVEKSELCKLYPTLFLTFLAPAFKFHALSFESRAINFLDFKTSSYLLRNYTVSYCDKRIVIPNFSTIMQYRELSFYISTRSTYELKIYPKGFSPDNEEFKCLVYTSLIIDQPRVVEFQLSIVSDSEVLKTIAGYKTFSNSRYTFDTEIEKQVSLHKLLEKDSPYIVNDSLILQISLKRPY